jgi:hypothetical protein
MGIILVAKRIQIFNFEYYRENIVNKNNNFNKTFIKI